MPRRVESESAPNVESSEAFKCLTIWFTIGQFEKNVKREFGEAAAGRTARPKLLAVDGTVFHYKGNLLEDGDVVERISRDGDYIGCESGFEDADFVLPAQ
jgi:hypothetical protein